MNREEITGWVELGGDEATDDILTHEAIINGVINPTVPKDIHSEEDDVNETMNDT